MANSFVFGRRASANRVGVNRAAAHRVAAVVESVEPRRLFSGGSGGTPPAIASSLMPAVTANLSGSSSSGSSTSSTTTTKSGDKSPIFDFTDAFYLANGIDPTKIAGRPNGTGTNSVVDTATDPTRRNVRITAVVGAHDDGGNAALFSILGTIQANAFTNDAAGRRARQIADQYVAYIFPRAGSNPLSPASKRQDELIPLNNGYYSNDPLNVWREVFVNYVPAALATPAGQKVANDLTARNGRDLDGTPFIRTLNDLEKAQQAGIVSVTRRADDGSQGAPWFFCPVYKDPRNGAITKDATLTIVRNADGTAAAGSRDVEALFNSVQVK